VKGPKSKKRRWDKPKEVHDEEISADIKKGGAYGNPI